MSDYGLQDHSSRILAQLEDMHELNADELAELEDDPDAAVDQIVDNDIEIVDESVSAGTTVVPNHHQENMMSLNLVLILLICS